MVHFSKTCIILAIIAVSLSCESRSPITVEHAEKYSPVENIAIIVEPREHQLLVPIIENAMSVLGDSWKIQIFHGTENGNFIRNSSLSSKIKEGQIYLSQLNRSNITVSNYNDLLLSRHFWDNVLGERVLVFQTDSILCGGSSHKIDDFFKYDYVGAPWDENKYEFHCGIYQGSHSIFVGNGGLSFRKRSATLKVLERYVPQSGINEDIFFSCLGSELKVPTVEEAKSFSVETTFYAQPFGVHKPWLYLEKNQMMVLEENCPDIEILKGHYAKADPSVWGQ